MSSGVRAAGSRERVVDAAPDDTIVYEITSLTYDQRNSVVASCERCGVRYCFYDDGNRTMATPTTSR